MARTIRWNGVDIPAHADMHAAGAPDAVAGAGGSGYSQIRANGSNVTVRTNLNFTGAGVTVTDNSGTSATDVTIPSGGGTPSGSVTSETTFGQSPAAGSSTAYSRGDHTHGTPGAPSLAVPFLSVAKWGID